VRAHKGEKLEYVLTGGADGAVRVWRLSTREMISQFAEQTKPVISVLVDCTQSNLVHSISIDGSIMTYDIIKQRRTVAHFIPKGAHLASFTQRIDSEQELITCDTGGQISVWDCDVRDPVASLQDPDHTHIRCASISPSSLYLAYAGDNRMIKILNIQTSEIVSVGMAHSGAVTTLAWTPDERQLVSGDEDYSLCVWNFFLSA